MCASKKPWSTGVYFLSAGVERQLPRHASNTPVQVAAEETPDGHVFLAETLVRAGKIPEAVVHYERASLLYDDARERAAALAAAARLHVESGGVDAAVEAYSRVLAAQPGAHSPEAGDAHVLLAARRLAEGGRLDVLAAVAHLRKAARAAPSLAAAHVLLADGYRDLGRPDLAARALERATEYQPRDAGGLAQLAGTAAEINPSPWLQRASIRPGSSMDRRRASRVGLQLASRPRTSRIGRDATENMKR